MFPQAIISLDDDSNYLDKSTLITRAKVINGEVGVVGASFGPFPYSAENKPVIQIPHRGRSLQSRR